MAFDTVKFGGEVLKMRKRSERKRTKNTVGQGPRKRIENDGKESPRVWRIGSGTRG